MPNSKQERILELFFRFLKGEHISIQALADEYNVSTKSISRSVNDLKIFLAEHRNLVGNIELQYSYITHCYHLYVEDFLSNKELFALVEVIIGARALSKMELLTLVNKLNFFTTPEDRPFMKELIRKELYQYPEVKHDCESVQDHLWKIVSCIRDSKEISITYYRMDRKLVIHRIRPATVLFTDFYFYLIAFEVGSELPHYFRIDRIKDITIHRHVSNPERVPEFDEGLLRKQSLLMWPGPLRTVRFEFTGPSVQAVLDKLPTARIIERVDSKRYIIEAEVYGDGIKMWLLSQGSWAKVLAPDDFVKEMESEIRKMLTLYEST